MGRFLYVLAIMVHAFAVFGQVTQPPVIYNGHAYPVVLIGDQWWFADNLRTERYRNGDTIPSLPQAKDWRNTRTGAQAVYRSDPGMLAVHGRLYNWYAVTDPRGICPQGWRVPSAADWEALALAMGG